MAVNGCVAAVVALLATAAAAFEVVAGAADDQGGDLASEAAPPELGLVDIAERSKNVEMELEGHQIQEFVATYLRFVVCLGRSTTVAEAAAAVCEVGSCRETSTLPSSPTGCCCGKKRTGGEQGLEQEEEVQLLRRPAVAGQGLLQPTPQVAQFEY